MVVLRGHSTDRARAGHCGTPMREDTGPDAQVLPGNDGRRAERGATSSPALPFAQSLWVARSSRCRHRCWAPPLGYCNEETRDFAEQPTTRSSRKSWRIKIGRGANTGVGCTGFHRALGPHPGNGDERQCQKDKSDNAGQGKARTVPNAPSNRGCKELSGDSGSTWLATAGFARHEG